ncbi:MAG: cell division ATP-binding protein FtsE [Candidatus Nitronauta litoralis]|uniref:Cell division ATP-binding protein FtsE n=1 Tax=Candidatus Nitronauta litoralis TaxID=2705533 RepID=A0A7T0G1X1_9BACT|nr:MAG: cell division ATP-binding protein FtsE [Candidatus Nitronauta litoralis]
MIQLYNVYKAYQSSHPVLVDISMVIREGAFVFITGPSGAGKSTLLKLLFRWEKFDRGQVLVNRMNIGKIPEDRLYLLRRKIGVVFQDYKLLPNKTIFENVAFALEIMGANRKTIRYQTWEALKNVGLTHKKDAYPLQLSGGEQQRTAIARALVNRPKILLADEPTGNLDPDIATEILKLFEAANRAGTTIVLATHSQDLLRQSDHPIVTLNQGRILETQFTG